MPRGMIKDSIGRRVIQTLFATLGHRMRAEKLLSWVAGDKRLCVSQLFVACRKPLALRYLDETDGLYTLTSLGLSVMQADARANAPPAEALPLVPSRSAPPYRPLRPRGGGPIREGALEYREIPSLMGGVRMLPGGEVVE